MFFELVPDAYHPLDLPPPILPQMQVQDSKNPVDLTIAVTAVLIILALLSSIAVIVWSDEQKENASATLRSRLATLEDELDELRAEQKRFCSEQKEQKERLEAFEEYAVEADQTMRREFEKLEKKMKDEMNARMDFVGSTMEEAIEKRAVSIESKIPRSTRNLSISLDTIQLRYRSLVGGVRGRPGHMVGPIGMNSLTNPRLVLEWAILPDGMPSSPVPESFQMKETITTNRIDRIIPAGQRAILLKAEVWHSTPNIVENLDCTGFLQQFFDT